MATKLADDLRQAHCTPCSGKTPTISEADARARLRSLDGWDLANEATTLRKRWRQHDFTAAMAFCNRVAGLAEREGHHPDLHITGFRNVAIELSTHAIGGLSDNDFILAAKIDALENGAKISRHDQPTSRDGGLQ